MLRSINISVNVELVKMRTILELTDGRFVRHPANIASIVFSSIVIFLCRYIRHLILEFKLFDDISWRKFPIYSPSYFKALTILSSCLLLGVRNIIKSINFYSFMYKKLLSFMVIKLLLWDNQFSLHRCRREIRIKAR